MNEQWTSGRNTHGNVSKDKRTMIRYDFSLKVSQVEFMLCNINRLSGVLHVLYYTMGECLKILPATDDDASADELTSTQFHIPSIIPEEVAHMAVHLTEYYQSQRLAYEEV